MAAPFLERYFPVMTPEQQLARRIDDHYHLGMIAKDSRTISDYSARALRIQHEAAIANLRAIGEVAKRQDQTNELLGQTNSLLSCLVGGMERLNETAERLHDAVQYQTSVLQDGFDQIAKGMLKQQTVLEQISATLSHRYESEALELLGHADRALKKGMQSTGRDQKEEYADARTLLERVIANPIGARNYVAWFQLGWLAWKDKKDYAAAEEAFYQASRLSSTSGDLYHANGLRHLAYMHYWRKNYDDAHSTIYKALTANPSDHDTRYDAARYAAKLGKESEVVSLLGSCIDQQPQTIVAMFSEEDFGAPRIKAAIAELAIRKTESSRQFAQTNATLWLRTMEAANLARKNAGLAVVNFDSQTAELQKTIPLISSKSHVDAVALGKRALAEITATGDTTIQELKHEVKSRDARCGLAGSAKEKAQFALKREVDNFTAASSQVKIGSPKWWMYVIALAIAFFIGTKIVTQANVTKDAFVFGLLFFFLGWWPFVHVLNFTRYLLNRRDAQHRVSRANEKYMAFDSSDHGLRLNKDTAAALDARSAAEVALSQMSDSMERISRQLRASPVSESTGR